MALTFSTRNERRFTADSSECHHEDSFGKFLTRHHESSLLSQLFTIYLYTSHRKALQKYSDAVNAFMSPRQMQRLRASSNEAPTSSPTGEDEKKDSILINIVIPKSAADGIFRKKEGLLESISDATGCGIVFSGDDSSSSNDANDDDYDGGGKSHRRTSEEIVFFSAANLEQVVDAVRAVLSHMLEEPRLRRYENVTTNYHSSPSSPSAVRGEKKPSFEALKQRAVSAGLSSPAERSAYPAYGRPQAAFPSPAPAAVGYNLVTFSRIPYVVYANNLFSSLL